MKTLIVILVMYLILSGSFFVQAQDIKSIRVNYSKFEFSYDKVSGIGHEKGCTRRDPSDVIKAGDSWVVYYTKIYGRAPGYWGTVWYATSKDEGYTWNEQGEILGLGKKDMFDSQATFTPNILFAKGKYYLYYTGVKPTPGNEKGEFENNSTNDITAIGVAMSDSPGGPFVRVSNEPILKVSMEPEKFDSYRVDDAALLYRNGLFWLYYKGRSRINGAGGPAHTQMGVAFSKNPEGPFKKYGKPILPQSHEVTIWQEGTGIAALASISSTFEYAPDGIDFLSNKLGVKVENRPLAPGVFRQDLTDPAIQGEGLKWGISMVHNGDECYLIRYCQKSKTSSINIAADTLLVPRSSLEKNLGWVGVAVEDPDYTIWGGAPIIGDDGKVHLFCARWPENNVNPAWRKSSEIAHYVADRPEGPFRFHDVAATGTGRDTWDRYTAHNPEIYKIKDTYVLLYTANTDFNQPPHPLNQSIGMKVSKSLNGPWISLPYTGYPLSQAPQGRNVTNWKTTGTDGLLITASPDTNHWTHGWQVANPGMLQVGDKFLLYFKSRYKFQDKTSSAIGLAVADRLEGPYVMGDKPLVWVDNFIIESPVPFHWDGKVCLLTSDNHGKLTGIPGAQALWVSGDGGRTFPRKSVQLACDLIPHYFHDYQPATVKKIYGADPKIEEARILHINGKPAYLYGSSGFAVHGGQRTACYVFRINLKSGDGPLPIPPKPTPQQLAWQEAELGVLFHIDPRIYNQDIAQNVRNICAIPLKNAEAYANRFNPTQLNTDQWIATAKAMGARYAILVAKHETGFCLWQSDANPYCLKNIQWREGKGDIVRDFVASCRKYGLRPALFTEARWNVQLGVYDHKVGKQSPISQAGYNRLIEREVEELCTRYGDLFEIWWDAGVMDPSADGPDVAPIIRKRQPQAIFYPSGGDHRWAGSESGTVSYPCWSTITPGKHVTRKLMATGEPDGITWSPAMADVTLRKQWWFWAPNTDHTVAPLRELQEIYYNSVGRNATLVVGIVPDLSGLIPSPDTVRCREYGDWIKQTFGGKPLAETSGNGREFTLEIPADNTTPVTHIILQEQILNGERVRTYVVEAETDGAWKQVGSGSCIGHKRIEKIEPCAARKFRLRITESVGEPQIRAFTLRAGMAEGATTATRKRVLILGDSHSMGYTPALARIYPEVQIVRPGGNHCGTKNALKHLDHWLGDGKWDVIHFNFGMHDFKRIVPGTEKSGDNPNEPIWVQASTDPKDPIWVSPEQYRKNLIQIVKCLKQTGAKLIFATTTPVPEDVHNRVVNQQHPPVYNKIAVEVMKENGIAVNDVYSYVLPHLKTWQLEKNVHFNATGSLKIAEKIKAAIQESLK